jgi:GDP-4-dehydro-6-deoxy-D-mannose reductase
MTTTLVTGAGGFAGGHLLDLLTHAADSPAATVAGWFRPGGRAPSAPSSGRDVQVEEVDLLDRGAVHDAIARIRPDIVYHCAGAAHVGRAWEKTEQTFAVNVRATHHLLDALDATNAVVRVLIPSSALVYAGADRPLTEDEPLLPDSPYGVSKLAQELLGRHASERVQVLIARAFNHIGPGQNPMFAAAGFARRIADIERGQWAPEISVGNLDARRDLTDVRDTVRAYRLIVDRGRPGRAYNVCSGEAIAIGELLDRLIAKARVPVTIRRDPARYRPNDLPLLLGDPTRIQRELGWHAEIPIDRTLDDLLDYWRNGERQKAEGKT